MIQVHKNGIARSIPPSQQQEYQAAGWTTAAEKKTKARAEVAVVEDPSPIADSGSPEALASVTTQAQPGDIITLKGDA
jgi:hypothetical protein